MEFPFQQKRRQSPRWKAKQWEVPNAIDHAEWTWPLKEVLLRCYYEQVVLGGGIKGNLTKRAWNGVKASFCFKTGLNHDITQLRNEFRKLKKHYTFIMDLVRRQTGAGLHPITGAIDQDEGWSMTKNVELKGKAMPYQYVDVRPYCDFGPAVFEGNMATCEYSIAPTKYSNTFHATGEDLDDSDPDKGEGSSDSGDGWPPENPHVMEMLGMTGSGGSSGKRKRIVMATSSLVIGCQRRLAVTEMTRGSMQTTGKAKATQVDADSVLIPSIGQCMRKISDLELSNLNLHTHAIFLLADPENSQILYSFTSTVGRDAWLIATKNGITVDVNRS